MPSRERGREALVPGVDHFEKPEWPFPPATPNAPILKPHHATITESRVNPLTALKVRP